MEIIIGILAAILGGMFLHSRNASKVAAKQRETEIRDQALKEQQEAVQGAIKALDEGIEKAKRDKELLDAKNARRNLTLKERAEQIKKGLK